MKAAMKKAARMLCWLRKNLFTGDGGTVGREAADDLDCRPACACRAGRRLPLRLGRLPADFRFGTQVLDADGVLIDGRGADLVGAAQRERERADFAGERDLLAVFGPTRNRRAGEANSALR
jgi:hypothetical protein